MLFSFIFFRSKHSQTKENWLEYKPNPQSMELKYNTLFVLNETMIALDAQVHWCSCNILSKRDHAIAVGFARDSATVFTWNGETLQEYRWCTNCMLSTRVMMVGPISLLMMVGKLISPSMRMLRLRRSKRRVVWRQIPRSTIRWSGDWLEDTATGVKRLYQMQANGSLLLTLIWWFHHQEQDKQKIIIIIVFSF